MKTKASFAKLSKDQIAAKIAALQAKLEDDDGGVYEDPATGRWFIVMRPPGATKTTTRRRAPDGSRLRTRDEALIAARPVGGADGQRRGRDRPRALRELWPHYLRHAKAEMTRGSWEDLRAHGTKRLLPFFSGMQMSRIGVETVREWRATMHEAVEAGEWAPKTINNARIALLGCFRMAVADRLMAHNPVLDVKPLPIDFTERPYLRLGQINGYIDACAPHYRPLAAVLVGTGARVSEAIALGIDDVDLAGRSGQDPQATRARRDARDPRPTKGRNFRTVAIGPGLARCCATCSRYGPSTGSTTAAGCFSARRPRAAATPVARSRAAASQDRPRLARAGAGGRRPGRPPAARRCATRPRPRGWGRAAHWSSCARNSATAR